MRWLVPFAGLLFMWLLVGCSAPAEPAADASGAGSAMEKTETDGAANPAATTDEGP